MSKKTTQPDPDVPAAYRWDPEQGAVPIDPAPEPATPDPAPVAPVAPVAPEEPTHRPTGLPSDALMQERRARYAAHLPLHALRTSQVPTELRNLPAFVALDAERTAVHEAEFRLARSHGEWQQEAQSVQGLHEAAMRDALLDGTPPPPPLQTPEWPYPDAADGILMDFHRVIEATEAGMLEENADEYAAMISEASVPALEEVAEAQRRLDAAKAKASPFNQALQRLRRGRAGEEVELNDVERRDVRRGRYSPTMDEEEHVHPREVEAMLLDQRRAPNRRRGRR